MSTIKFPLAQWILNLSLLIVVAAAVVIPLVFYLNVNHMKKMHIPNVDFSSDKFKYYVDKCELKHGDLIVYGWAAILGDDRVSLTDVFIKTVRGDYLKLKSRVRPRPDVDKFLGISFSMSRPGFYASSSLTSEDVKTPFEVILVKRDVNGKAMGSTYVCN
jgi:hypothetical protein